MTLLLTSSLWAAGDWKDATSRFAGEIGSGLGTGSSVLLTVRNRSSLAEEDVAVVRRMLQAALRKQGLRLVATTQATAAVQVMLSENSQGFLWVAEIQRRESRTVTMMSVPRTQAGEPVQKAELLAIWKTTLLEQNEPILDVAVFEAPGEDMSRLLVLEPGKISIYSKNDASWQLAQSASIPRGISSLPRDPRGRLVTGPNQSFDAYLPGEKCSGLLQPSLSLECHAGDDSWPLGTISPNEESAEYVPARNHFSGKIRSRAGEGSVPPFFSAAEIMVNGRDLRVYAGLDGRSQVLEKGVAPIAVIDGWGSDVVGLKTGCGSGWQVLATRPGDYMTSDALQAYEIVGREAVPVSAPVEFPGPVTALWAASDGASATVISRIIETGKYEAVRLSVSCSR